MSVLSSLGELLGRDLETLPPEELRGVLRRLQEEAAEETRSTLRGLEEVSRQLREELGMAAPGAVLFQQLSAAGQIVVVADGAGGARMLECSGLYPLHVTVLREHAFVYEAEALAFAQAALAAGPAAA